MKYDRRDKSKVIGLVLILLVFWLGLIFEFTTLSRRTKAKLDQHEREHAAARAQAGQAPTGAMANPALRLAALVAPIAPPRSDPFRPLIPPRNAQRAAPRQERAAAEPTPGEAPLPPMPDSSSGQSLSLKGIIAGNPSAAILRLGESHYVVREGDLVEGNLRVQQITRNTVVLREGRSTYTLHLGR